jgi:hypothetical protein
MSVTSIIWIIWIVFSGIMSLVTGAASKKGLVEHWGSWFMFPLWFPLGLLVAVYFRVRGWISMKDYFIFCGNLLLGKSQ